jgi:hypothetical protein
MDAYTDVTVAKSDSVVRRDFFRLEVLNNRLMAQYYRDGAIYATEDHWVFRSVDNGCSWERMCKLERRDRHMCGAIKDRLLRSDAVRRIRRKIGIHNLVVLESGTLLIHYDGIYRYDGIGTTARRVFGFEKDRIIGSLKNGFIVDDRAGNVYFGEYNNTRPYAARIIRGRNDGTKWEVCYRFPKGRIKHVHAIAPDPYRKRLWICTGDNDAETCLFFTDDDFKTVEEFMGCSQISRMVGLIPTEDAIYWGSDAGRDIEGSFINQIFRFDFRRKRLESLAAIHQPAYFSARLNDGSMIIATTYECGIKRPMASTADLWYSASGSKWERILCLPYGPARRREGTRYATINLPLGTMNADTIFFTPVNVKDNHFKLLALHRNKLGPWHAETFTGFQKENIPTRGQAGPVKVLRSRLSSNQ